MNQQWHEAMYGSPLRPHVECRERLTPEKLNSGRTRLSKETSKPACAAASPEKFVPPARDAAGAATEVEAFLARNDCVDGEIAEQLRQLPPKFQREVLLWGDVAQARSPSQQLMRHIHDVVNGTHSSTTRDNSSNVLRSIWPKLHDGDCRFLLTAGAPKLGKTTGRWYYEAELGRGITETHIGWATREGCQGCIGRDENGWAADGLRHLHWNGDTTKVKWPQTWKAGDIIGCAIDLDAGEMIFFHDGMWALPVPFKRLDNTCPVFPAVTARGDFTLCFTEATFKYFPSELGFKALMDAREASTVYGCRGDFSRPGAQDELAAESPRQKGIRIYKDSPLQHSVVDLVVFGRDMDFSGCKQFNDDFMKLYKGRHGIASVHTDINFEDKVSKPGMRHYACKPEFKSVVNAIIAGRDAKGDMRYGDDFDGLYDGAAGKPSVERGSERDQPAREGRKQLNVMDRYRWLQEAKKPPKR